MSHKISEEKRRSWVRIFVKKLRKSDRVSAEIRRIIKMSVEFAQESTEILAIWNSIKTEGGKDLFMCVFNNKVASGNFRSSNTFRFWAEIGLLSSGRLELYSFSKAKYHASTDNDYLVLANIRTKASVKGMENSKYFLYPQLLNMNWRQRKRILKRTILSPTRRQLVWNLVQGVCGRVV